MNVDPNEDLDAQTSHNRSPNQRTPRTATERQTAGYRKEMFA